MVRSLPEGARRSQRLFGAQCRFFNYRRRPEPVHLIDQFRRLGSAKHVDTFAGISPHVAPMFIAAQLIGAGLAAITAKWLFSPAA
jgi:hypothetical protein